MTPSSQGELRRLDAGTARPERRTGAPSNCPRANRSRLRYRKRFSPYLSIRLAGMPIGLHVVLDCLKLGTHGLSKPRLARGRP